MSLTVEEIKRVIHNLDLIKRPWIVFANPKDARDIRDVLPRIEEEVVIEESENIEIGKAVAIEREKFEKWANNDFGYTRTELE